MGKNASTTIRAADALGRSRAARLVLLFALLLVGGWRVAQALGLAEAAHPESSHTDRLEAELTAAFPYSPLKPFPRLIWQTWKVGLDLPKFPRQFLKTARRWRDNNEGWLYELVPDDRCVSFVERLYRDVPEVVEAYHAMPTAILKADFFRYLILYARGGVYTDVDTALLKPIDVWPSMLGDPLLDPSGSQTVGMAIGIEADPDKPDWHKWYARRLQFCQWTIQAKPGHPMLAMLVSHITAHTLERKRTGTLALARGDARGADIMMWTGPGVWSDTVFRYMNREAGAEGDGTSDTHRVSWRLFTNTRDPTVTGDIMVLPITAFSPGVGHMGAEDISSPRALAQHLFGGSWKDAKDP